jgi:hypothetical protein
MVSICYVPIHSDISDLSSELTNTILCEETQEPINDKTIVEMIYKPENPPGWRWVPMRVRWDKTELYSRGEISGTMNDISSATSVFNSIHDPITEKMIRTGNMSDDTLDMEYKQSAYYKRKAGQDRYITGGMVSFHNQYIKDKLLLATTITPGASLLDMSVGRAGDMHKWIGGKVGWVLGCDIALPGLIEPDGAYDRYLKQMILKKGAVPKMIFVQADSALRYSDGSAGLSAMDSSILRSLWGGAEEDAPPAVKELAGKAAEGFDVATSMFALHYFFKNKQMIGKGCGQTSRIDALRHAIEKAKQFNFDLKDAVLASDAFFPFDDCVKIAHEAGITSFIQPGGSIRDADSINYCKEQNLVMVITGQRHFKH